MKWSKHSDYKYKHVRQHSAEQKLHFSENSRGYTYISYPPSKLHYAVWLLKKIWRDRKLRFLVILSFMAIKILSILAFLFFVYEGGEMMENISEKGLSGIIETAGSLISTLRNSF